MFLDMIMSSNQKNVYTNGRSQINRDQKSSISFLQRHDKPRWFWGRFVKNRQKELQWDYYLLHWIHPN